LFLFAFGHDSYALAPQDSRTERLPIPNDDGIGAAGLNARRARFWRSHHRCPAAPQSGVSHAVTWYEGGRIEPRGEKRQSGSDRFAIHGTPAVCIRLGLLHLVPDANWAIGRSSPVSSPRFSAFFDIWYPLDPKSLPAFQFSAFAFSRLVFPGRLQPPRPHAQGRCRARVKDISPAEAVGHYSLTSTQTGCAGDIACSDSNRCSLANVNAMLGI
jgi:Survival protein SurE